MNTDLQVGSKVKVISRKSMFEGLIAKVFEEKTIAKIVLYGCEFSLEHGKCKKMV